MKTKVCSKCKKEKLITEFYRNKAYKDGYAYWCKKCLKQYFPYDKCGKVWAQNNKEKRKEYHKEYLKNNREKILKQRKEYRQKNKEKLREYNMKWSKENYHRRWAISTLLNHKRRGYQIKITKDELTKIAKETKYCPFCNNPLDWKYGKGKSQNNSPSLDRTDNGNDLTLNNTQIICWLCNKTKQNRTMKEFINYCEMIYQKFGTLTVIPVNVFIDRGYGEPKK